jgi:sugar O-acyltransferase (sialic acid O-acetyltransferase NeuD family)
VSDARPVLVLGTGTFAEEIADVVAEVPGLRPVAFVENLDRDRCGSTLQGRPVLWVDELPGRAATHLAVCGLGTTRRHRFTDQADAAGISFATPVHPLARVSPTTTLGPGTIVGVAVVIAAHTRLGRHVSVNRGALMGHHTEIGDFVTVGPGSNIAGNCRIGAGTYVGMGAVIIDHVTVGAGSVIGAGAVVTRDLPERVLAVGVPAKIVREDVEPK